MGTVTLVAPPVDEARDLTGPDLDALAPLSQQIEWLDALTSDPCRYATLWLSISDQCGLYSSVNWRASASADHEGDICSGVHMDAQEHDRRSRSDHFFEHLATIEGARRQVVHLLLSRGRFLDDRRTSVSELFATLRSFLVIGGAVKINPAGRLECSGGWPGTRWRDVSEDDLETTQAMARIARRRQARRLLARIVRRVGRPVSGWIVLEVSNG